MADQPNSVQQQQNEMMQTVISLNLTISQVQSILNILYTGPYNQVRTLIEEVTEQLQQRANELNAQRNASLQQPAQMGTIVQQAQPNQDWTKISSPPSPTS